MAGDTPRYAVGTGGPGLPLVLLPGIEGDPRIWLNQVSLGSGWVVWALGIPGGAEGQGGMAEAVLAGVSAERFVVVGASLGGLVGWAMAAAAPERVAGLVTMNSLPGRELAPRSVVVARRLLAGVPHRVFSELYGRRIQGRMVAEGVEPWLADALTADLPGKAELRRRLAAVVAWGLPSATGVPTLWLRGQTGREAPWSGADVARLLPGVHSEVVPGGHRAMLTHSGGVNAAVAGWVLGV